MSRHLVEPEVAAGLVSHLPETRSEETLDHRSPDGDHPHTGPFGWTRTHNRFGWTAMQGGAEITPHLSPATADDLSGLPPTYIHSGAIDRFFEEALDHARHLTRAGVSVELHVWPGAYHAFQKVNAHVSREARRVARTSLKRAVHSG